MADENKPDNDDDLDDLLSDFNDLFPGEDEDSEDTTQGSDEEKDDTDSFLGDLDELAEDSDDDHSEAETKNDLNSLLDGLEEQVEEISNDDSSLATDNLDALAVDDLDALEEQIEEIVGDDSSSEIDNDELILSVESEHTDGLNDEIVLDEPIPSSTEITSDDEPEVQPDMQYTAEMAEHRTALPDYDEEERPSEPSMGTDESLITKLSGMAVYIVLVVALGISGGSIWLSLQVQNVADYNRNSLSQLKEQQELVRRSISDSQYNPLVGKNSGAIRELDQRINEISMMVEGPLSQMNASTSEEVISILENRLQQLENNLAELKKVTAAKQPVVTTVSTIPAQNSWALNLLSLSSKKGADEVIQRLEVAGINSSLNQFTAKDGKTWYRVRVTGFANKEAAISYARTMPKVRGIDQTWVTAE
ncbi:MAG: hypothetical protein GQ470_01270 [Gammaproteobacteria bacterium]|nr:hypothetical protein [Gammaproteobacteria bacterium]